MPLSEKAFYYVESHGHIEDIGYECYVELRTVLATPRRSKERHGYSCEVQPIIWNTSSTAEGTGSASLMGLFPRCATTFLPFGSEYFNVVVAWLYA